MYQLGSQGAEVAYRYTDEQGRPWVIVIKAPEGVGADNPLLRLAQQVLATLRHE